MIVLKAKATRQWTVESRLSPFDATFTSAVAHATPITTDA